MNPLLDAAYPVPFDRILAEHAEPAVLSLIADCERELERIVAAEGPRTWDNTAGPLDDLTTRLDAAMTVIRHLSMTASTPEWREARAAAEGPATVFDSRLPRHDGLWRALRDYAATAEAASLTGARRRFLDKKLDEFRRNGAMLPESKKPELERIDVELNRVTTEFEQNLMDATNAFEWVTEDEAALAGLPASAIAMAREGAESKGVPGWRFTLQAPSYVAVMNYLDDAAVRERFHRAYHARAAGPPFDNRTRLVRILELRRAKAELLGYRDFADYVAEDRMAGSGTRAHEFLTDLRARATAAFEAENRELLEFRRSIEGPDAPPLAAWDVSYYAEKLRLARFDLEEEMLRPYFPMDRVLDGLFETARRLFGVTVTETEGVPAWDPRVRFHEIRDADGTLLGSFYADWFPRENKRGGAWMDAFLTGRPSGDGSFGPHLGLMCGNMTPPSGGRPALLTHREVETVFHEFGHLLHHCLSRVEVRSLAGTAVAWDFVELPSQIMENWCWERESLDLFAAHWETGEKLPQDLFERMRRARTFRSANHMMRQLAFGLIDLALHREYDPARDGDVLDYCRRLHAGFSPAPLYGEYAMITGFSHLFTSPVGYAAGYYSYKWAEALEADAFTVFRRDGIFNAAAGRRFRDGILARGDSEDPAALFRAFVGRDPDPAALLARAGLA